MNFRQAFILSLFIAAGCAKPKLPPAPPAPPPRAEASPVGAWESSMRGEKTLRMIFASNGQLSFEGGLQFFNPARWDYNPMSDELVLSFPQTDDSKLQVFKLSVGSGVKALDRPGKRVTYTFNHDTAELDVGGWVFSRAVPAAATPAIRIAPEPTLR